MRASGVVAISTANRAQRVGRHCRPLQVSATVIMPRPTPLTKIGNTNRLGTTVLLVQRRRRYRRGPRCGRARNADNDALDAILVPVGGGLLAGMPVALKARRPDIQTLESRLIFIPRSGTCLTPPLLAPARPTIAKGTAVKTLGTLTMKRSFAIWSMTSSRCWRRTSRRRSCNSRDREDSRRSAAGLTAVTADPGCFKGRRPGLVVSGGNIDSRLLSILILRGVGRSKRLTRLRIVAPGTVARICDAVPELALTSSRCAINALSCSAAPRWRKSR
ncbi:threonine dehydratase [Arboricoccus pini]|uniref:Threonine dehydratase n=1 Tax=Arboricoccus pini TaxID=1963835 RepID=A0A212QTG0_9PROT|nr:threonine dehydratase [Arboricoccus pini]